MIDGFVPLVLKLGAIFALGSAVYINVPATNNLQPATRPDTATAIFEQTYQLQNANFQVQGE